MQYPRSKILTAFFTATALSLAGCNSGNDGGLIGTSSGTGSIQVRVALKFAGTYSTTCELEEPADPEFNFAGSYAISQITLGETSGTTRTYYYTDDECTQPNSPAEGMVEFSLVYPGGTQETQQGKADFVDVTVQSVTVDGQRITDDDSIELADDVFDTQYHIRLVDGDLLYLSGEGEGEFDGTTEERRFNTLDEIPLMRQ